MIWKNIALTGNSGWAAAVNPDGTHAIAGNTRLYLSSDAGKTWSETYPAGDIDYVWSSVASDSDNSRIIAGSLYGRLYLTSNGGADWTEVRPSGDDSDLNWNSVSMSSDGKHIIAAKINPYEVPNQGRLFLSSNSGIDWSETRPAGDNDLNWYTTAMNSDGTHLLAGAADWFFDSTGRLYKSSNSGADWTEIRPTGEDVNTIWIDSAISANGSNMIVVRQDLSIDPFGVYLSYNNGVDWTEVKPVGDASQEWFCTAMSPDGTVLYAATVTNLYESIDGGSSWSDITSISDQWRSVATSGELTIAGGFRGYYSPPYIGRLYRGNSKGVKANFSVDTDFYSNIPVAFQDLSIGAPNAPSIWDWTFGDGTTSTLQNPSHTYLIDGTYTPSLTVYGNDDTDTVSYGSVLFTELGWTHISGTDGGGWADIKSFIEFKDMEFTYTLDWNGDFPRIRRKSRGEARDSWTTIMDGSANNVFYTDSTTLHMSMSNPGRDIFSTIDGTSWDSTSVAFNPPLLGVDQVVTYPVYLWEKNGCFYGQVNTAMPDWTSDVGVSLDGKSWSELNIPYNFSPQAFIGYGDYLYTTGSIHIGGHYKGGILRTSDGTTWNLLYSTSNNSATIRGIDSLDSTLYAVESITHDWNYNTCTIIRSENGVDWTNIKTFDNGEPIPALDESIAEFRVLKTFNTKLYIVGYSYYYVDGGGYTRYVDGVMHSFNGVDWTSELIAFNEAFSYFHATNSLLYFYGWTPGYI